MTANAKRIILIIILLVGCLTGVLIYISKKSNQTLTAVLELEVAPSGADIKVANKGVRGGKHRIAPGEHIIKFSKSGFKSEDRKVILKEAETKYLGVILSPDSPETEDWYKKHPKDAKIAEGISSRSIDETQKQLLAKYPFIKFLPYESQHFRIDTGRSEKTPSDPNSIAIYIVADDEKYKDEAIIWLQNKGAQTNELEIVSKITTPALVNPVRF